MQLSVLLAKRHSFLRRCYTHTVVLGMLAPKARLRHRNCMLAIVTFQIFPVLSRTLLMSLIYSQENARRYL